MTTLAPRKGAVAFCKRGYLGLITSEKPEEITYPDGNKGMAWLGVQLTDKPPFSSDWKGPTGMGTLWSSRFPTVMAYIEDFTSQFTPTKEMEN